MNTTRFYKPLTAILLMLGALGAWALGITREANAPRRGDTLTMAEVNIPDSLMDSPVRIYDFSAVEIGHDCVREYLSPGKTASENVISSYEKGLLTNYVIIEDSLLRVTRRGRAGKIAIFSPGAEEIDSYYSHRPLASKYKYSGIVGANDPIMGFGTENHSPTVQCIVLTPDGEMLTDVTLCHSENYGPLITGAESIDNFKAITEIDSLLSAYPADSLYSMVVRDRFYAEGYRYPIIEREVHSLFYNRKEIDRATQSKYYSRLRQQQEIESDSVNVAKRENSELAHFVRNMSASRSRQSTAQSQASQYPNSRDTDDLIYIDNSDGYFAGSGSYINRMKNPNTIYLEVYSPTEYNLQVYLTSADGKILQTMNHNTAPSSRKRFYFNFNDYAPGVYLISVCGNGKWHTHKVVKK